MGTTRIYINESASDPAKALVESFLSSAPAAPLVFTQGDTARPLELHFLEENPDPSSQGQPFVYGTAPDSTKLGVGPLDLVASGGTFTITDTAGSQTTAAIAIGADAATTQTALRAGCTTNFSAATVTGTSIGTGFSIDRVTTGALADITISTAATTPENSVAEILNTDNGTASLSEKWAVKIVQRPALYQSSFSNVSYSAPADTSVTTGGSGVNAVHRLTWPSAAYAGSISLTHALPTSATPIAITSNTAASPTVFTTAAHGLTTGDKIYIATNNGSNLTVVGVHTVTVSDAVTFSIPVNCTGGAGTGGSFYKVSVSEIGPIPFNVTPSQLEDLYEAHASALAVDGSFVASKNAPGNLQVSFVGGLGAIPIPVATTVTSLLSTPVAVSGTLNCKTAGMLTLLNGSQEATTKFEIEKTISAVPTTVAYRDDITLRAELLST